MSRTTMDIDLHQETIVNVLQLLDILIVKMSEKIPKVSGLSENLVGIHAKLKGEYASRRNRNASPPPSRSPQQSTINIPNTVNDQDMSR